MKGSLNTVGGGCGAVIDNGDALCGTYRNGADVMAT